MAFTLPELPYPTSALEPHIDGRTMEIHHGKHHKAYVDNANKALAGTPWETADVEKVVREIGQVPENIRTAVRNNAGGHLNHSMFWKLMAAPGKGGGGEPTGPLMEAIRRAYGDFGHFKEEFAKAAAGRFGSGWAWLVVKGGGEVQICSTANQDNPLMGQAIAGCEGKPVLGLDVWEHAYYLNYQNRRPEYVTAWWNVVNWAEAGRNYEKARG
jgi:Fe-Mn family superoxide dismutase